MLQFYHFLLLLQVLWDLLKILIFAKKTFLVLKKNVKNIFNYEMKRKKSDKVFIGFKLFSFEKTKLFQKSLIQP